MINAIERHTRKPCVAGYFYPANPDALRDDIKAFLNAAEDTVLSRNYHPRAIIAPHAGYIYSGPIAGAAYQSLKQVAADIKRVVVLGPSHQVALNGAACPSDNFFATPLGDIELDSAEISRLEAQGLVDINDIAHAREHSIEVQLPFLQAVIPEFKLIPVVVGNADPFQIAALLEKFWRDPSSLIVISSDLSHYLDYYEAQKSDRDTSTAIEACRWQDIGPHQACGCFPMRGLLELAREENATITCLDLRNSGDTAGDKSRVVGYGAYVIE